MRAFVAVFPPPAVRQAALDAARPTSDRISWTRPENVHLTLKFLGDIPEESLESVRATLRASAVERVPFEARLSGLGAFPSERRARVVWAGVGAGSGELVTLASSVEATLEPLGFGREVRPYVPHATLGRCRGRPIGLDLPPIGSLGPVFRVQGLELVESKLASGGAVYETLETFALGGSYSR